MDITEKNGQPSMEEILASIRRIIAEEPAPGLPVIDLNATAIQTDASLDEHTDFELPSIFRTPAPAPEKSPLFGRLSDALRGATSATADAKGPLNGSLNGHHDAPHLTDGGPGRETNGSHGQFSTLSSLKGPRDDVSLPRIASVQVPASSLANSALSRPLSSGLEGAAPWRDPATPGPQPQPEDVKRVMVPFKDTHFVRFSDNAEVPQPAAASGRVAPTLPSPSIPAPRPRVDFGSIIPSRMDAARVAVEAPMPSDLEAAAEPAHMPWPERFTAPPEVSASYFGNPLQSSADQSQRPGLVEEVPSAGATQVPVEEAAPGGTIEDTTAELLRPMLRQWLADNMPRMVEKALHIEVAESVKTTKKFNGQ